MRAAVIFLLLSLSLFACTNSATTSSESFISKEISENWTFRQANGERAGKAQVPGTIHTDLMNNGLIEDPFYRTNEKNVQWIDKTDWEYSTTFVVSNDENNKENQELCFKGLDTYADVYLNDSLILQTDNMFRNWKIAVKGIAHEGENQLRLLLHSPINRGLAFLEKSAYPYPAANDQSENGGLGDKKVSIFTRKAGYHYGWDWGPRLVTSGIWRPVYFNAWDSGRIENVFIMQPDVTAQKASLVASVTFSANKESDVEVTIYQDNKKITSKKTKAIPGENQLELPFTISKPKLWWSNGLGEANLYTFTTQLKINGNVFHSISTQTGIKSLKLVRTPDDKGESFYFELNGVPVFAKGANYIPNDNFLPRVSRQQYEKVISDAVDANMNMLRVWGGGIYENDYFYELCDEQGIMVWQDFMFACSMYPGNEAFLKSVAAEAKDNIIRLRNHPSIVLWCGNNEIDAAWQYSNEHGGWGWKQRYSTQQRDEIQQAHLAIFHDILPSAVEKYTDGDYYWPSSPMSGDKPNQHSNYTSGDVHYWGVWHGLHKFSEFETNIGRFMSEYGFQSFPAFETVKKYALPEDYSIESEVMAAHQRSGIGNLRIREYMSWDYNVPTDFEQFLYVGQLLQSRGIKAAIEAHRRAMPFCMGSLYWQINDCWPVASWSSTDYYHNWKAMHYMARKAFMPVIISVFEKEGQITFTAASDQLQNIDTELEIKIIDFAGTELSKMTVPAQINANSATLLKTISKQELTGNSNPAHVALVASLKSNGKTLADNIFYFVPPKDLVMEKPALKVSVSEENGDKIIRLKSETLVKDIMLYVPDAQLAFIDNYFDMLPNTEYSVSVKTTMSAKELSEKLKFRDLSMK